ncbi:unnamed protein product [Haemonchus placei]|uniref:Retrotransposon gag protein n=1 Tax=Haemonchus placei TaxID=6290 RepID=A0A0N4X4N8_HAEPC|nr:unnamed protein product [Haemonchus placei]
MSATGYIKCQMTEALSSLAGKLAELEETTLEITEKERKTGEFGDSENIAYYDKKLLQGIIHITCWTSKSKETWKQSEDHSNKIQKEDDRYQLIQDFTDHWETIEAENTIVNAQVLAEVPEYLRRKMESNTKEESQNRTEGLFPTQIEVQFPKLELPDFEGGMVKFPEPGIVQAGSSQ